MPPPMAYMAVTICNACLPTPRPSSLDVIVRLRPADLLVEAGAGEVERAERDAACEAIRQLLVLSIDLIKIPS